MLRPYDVMLYGRLRLLHAEQSALRRCGAASQADKAALSVYNLKNYGCLQKLSAVFAGSSPCYCA